MTSRSLMQRVGQRVVSRLNNLRKNALRVERTYGENSLEAFESWNRYIAVKYNGSNK